MAKRTTKPLRLHDTRHPLLLEVNARVLVRELSAAAGSDLTLDRIPDHLLDEWAGLGFDAVWLMGVWTTGPQGREIARAHPGLQGEYLKILPDYTPEDVAGSPYSVQKYEVPPALGGNKALGTLRKRLAGRGLGLILDFVSNHTARDHAWTTTHPDYYINGESGDDRRRPDIYFSTPTAQGEKVLAFGRDPTFPSWTDTAQLNHMYPKARKAIIAELKKISRLCDGVRCDMAMLLLRDVFLLTWGEQLRKTESGAADVEFWKEAIRSVRRDQPKFLFMAEAYWNLEWQLQQLGFDFTYDKVLYDRLLREGAGAGRDHLRAEIGYQRRSVRFVENHDENRASRAFGSEAWHFAAAVIVSSIPGMTLYHDGELDGRAAKLPVQLTRRPQEPVSDVTRSFYQRLLSCVCSPVFRGGEWQLLSPRAAWHDNYTWQNFLVFWWQGKGNDARLVAVNYAPHSGQCYVELPVEQIAGVAIEFRDQMSDAAYVRDRAGLASRGIYFDLQGYGFHIFDVKKAR
jgi:hypothetical protein